MLDSDEEKEKSSSDEDERDAIAKEIFEGDIDEPAPADEDEASQRRVPPGPDVEEGESGEESGQYLMRILGVYKGSEIYMNVRQSLFNF